MKILFAEQIYAKTCHFGESSNANSKIPINHSTARCKSLKLSN